MRGFSLVEVLIVLAISIIVVSFAFPSQHIFLHQAHQRADSLKLLRSINFARTQALARNQSVVLCHSEDQVTCSGEWGGGYIVMAGHQVIFQFRGANAGKLHWRSFPVGKTNLEFMPTGRLNSENGTFWYCSEKAENPDWALVLSQSGRARLVYPDGNNQIKDEKGKLLVCV